MNQTASILGNSLSLFFSAAVRLVVNFLLFAGIGRLYGPVEFGQFATASVFSNFFLLLADFGFDTLLATEVARDRDQAARIAREFLSLKMISATIATVGMFIVPLVLSFSTSTSLLIYIFSLNVALSSMINFFFSLFKGLEKMRYEAQISFYINLLSLVCLIIIGLFHFPLYIFVITYIFTRALGIVLAMRIANKLLHGYWLLLSFDAWKKARHQVMVFGINVLSGLLYFQLDTLLLSLWKGDRAVGIYQAVFKIIVLVLVIPDIAVNTLLPSLTRFHQNQKEQWIWIGHLLYKVLYFTGLIVSMILFLYAGQIIHLIYGYQGFDEAIPVLRIFSLTSFIRFSAEPFGLMLTTSKRQEIRMWICIVAVIANVSLNAFMIPLYGPIGAAKVSLMTNIFVGLGYLAATRTFVSSWVFDVTTLLPLAMVLLVSLVIWSMPLKLNYILGLLGIAVSGAVIYKFGFTQEDRSRLLSLRGALNQAR